MGRYPCSVHTIPHGGEEEEEEEEEEALRNKGGTHN